MFTSSIAGSTFCFGFAYVSAMKRTLDYVLIQTVIKVKIWVLTSHISCAFRNFIHPISFTVTEQNTMQGRVWWWFLVAIHVDLLGSWKRLLQITAKFCTVIYYIIWLSHCTCLLSAIDLCCFKKCNVLWQRPSCEENGKAICRNVCLYFPKYWLSSLSDVVIWRIIK